MSCLQRIFTRTIHHGKRIMAPGRSSRHPSNGSSMMMMTMLDQDDELKLTTKRAALRKKALARLNEPHQDEEEHVSRAPARDPSSLAYVPPSSLDRSSPLGLFEEMLSFLHEEGADNIKLIDLTGSRQPVSYMIVCESDSARGRQAIAEAFSEQYRTYFISSPFPFHQTHAKVQNTDWIAFDLGFAFLHIMSPESRAYYDLEGLWSDPPNVVPLQAATEQ